MGNDKRLVPDFRIDQYEGRATIIRPDRRPVELLLQDAANLRSIVTRYALQVEKARPLGLPVPKDAAQNFLSFAKRLAYGCFVDATRGQYKILRDALDIVTTEMSKAMVRGKPMCVEITDNSGEYLPWEWLGVLDRGEDHISEALSTLGFAAIVYRRAPQEEASHEGMAADYLDAEPRLPVLFFRNPELYGTRNEQRFFRYNKYIELLGPLPEHSPDGQLDLAEHLVDPSGGISGTSRDRPDQAVHISCHHEEKVDLKTASAFSLLQSESLLKFGRDDEPNFEISLSNLGFDLTVANIRRESVQMPLIFFNACRGSFYPFTTESAMRVLLRNGNRGVISTAVNVPDDAAAELGRFFYERLLDGDCTAPEALLHARWALLHGRACPLGLLYSYYGIPDLRVLPVRCVHGENPIVNMLNGGSR